MTDELSGLDRRWPEATDEEQYLRDIDTQREFVWFGQGEGQAAVRNVRRIVDRYEAVLRRRGEWKDEADG